MVQMRWVESYTAASGNVPADRMLLEDHAALLHHEAVPLLDHVPVLVEPEDALVLRGLRLRVPGGGRRCGKETGRTWYINTLPTLRVCPSIPNPRRVT